MNLLYSSAAGKRGEDGDKKSFHSRFSHHCRVQAFLDGTTARCFRIVNSCTQTRFPVAVIPGISLTGENRAKLSLNGDDTFFSVSATVWDVD